MRHQLVRTLAALRRTIGALHSCEARIARQDRRAWVVTRRERTRHLIELGGLVAKAGIVELIEDDREVLYGVLLEAAATLRGDNREQTLMPWRRRGKRAFEEDAAAKG